MILFEKRNHKFRKNQPINRKTVGYSHVVDIICNNNVKFIRSTKPQPRKQ